MSENLVWKPKHSVKIRLILIQALLTTFLVIVLAAFLYIPTKQSIETASDDAYLVLTNNLVATVFNSLAAGDKDAIIAAAKRIEGVKGVSYVLVQDEKNTIIYDSLNEDLGKVLNDNTTELIHEKKNVVKVTNSRNNQKYFEYAAPFLISNNPQAIVRIAVLEKDIIGEFQNLRLIFLKISSAVLLIGVFVSYLLSVRITQPIRRLTESALAIRAGNLEVAANVHTDDEMEQLAREFRRMVDQLKTFYIKEVQEKEKAMENVKKVETINQKLRDLDVKKNEFLSIASHQLRTPLSVIFWTTSMVREGNLSSLTETQRKMLAETEKNARLMESLIGELLDLSRIQHGKRKLIIEEVEIVEFAKKIVAGFATLAESKGIKLTFEKGSQLIAKVESDKQALRHIISNLIDNALRYTNKDGKVLVRLDYEDGQFIIKVKDTGIGVTEEEKSKIFNQFTRGERAIRLSPDGSGLGLYFVKGLVESLNGSVNLESIAGQGSTFIVTMPVRQEKLAA